MSDEIALDRQAARNLINSPSQAAKDLADVSHDYVRIIYDTLRTNSDSWKNDNDVIDATENVLVKTGYYKGVPPGDLLRPRIEQKAFITHASLFEYE